MGRSIYLDNCATTPLDTRVLSAMMPYFEQEFGNASSRWHDLGRSAERATDNAREQIAGRLKCRSNDIIWTSGATEANNLAIKGAVSQLASSGRAHIITQASEHPAVLDACLSLSAAGVEVTVLPVDENGLVSPDQLRGEIRPNTALVSIMWANNEIGTIQPIREIGSICREHGIVFHTDATQAIGKMPINLEEEPVDLLSLSAHKFYGPKGVGALVFRRSDKLRKLVPLIHGGGHERGHRSGTLNVPGIVGAGEACEICHIEMAREIPEIERLRNRFESQLTSSLPSVIVNAAGASRIANVSNICFLGVDAESMLIALDGIAASTGSACSSASLEPSHVLKSLRLSLEQLRSAVRFSFGRFNTSSDVDDAAAAVVFAVRKLRQLQSWE